MAPTSGWRAVSRPAPAPRLRRGEEAAVVLQHHEVVGDQPAVGGVDVERVDVPRGGRLVLERVLHRLDRAEVEPVDPFRPSRPSSRPTNSWPKPPRRRGATRRGRRSSSAVRLGQLLGHRHLEGVLEAQRSEPPEVPALEELAAHPLQRLGRPACARLAEDRDAGRCRCTRGRGRWRRSSGLRSRPGCRRARAGARLRDRCGPPGAARRSRPGAGSPRSSSSRPRRGGGESGSGEKEGEEKKPHPLAPSPAPDPARREMGDVTGAVLPRRKARRPPSVPPSPAWQAGHLRAPRGSRSYASSSALT